MKTRAVTLAVASLAVLAPRVARPCSYNPCYFGSPRIGAIEALSQSPVPRDGAFVFMTDQDVSPTCLADLAPNLAIVVEHAGEPVPGELVQLAGLPHVLIWRPGAQLIPGGSYAAQIVVDNDGLGPAEVQFSTCGPAQLVASFMFTVDDALAAAPLPPAPDLSAVSTSLNQSLLGYACCPDVLPFYDDGSCEPMVHWDFDEPDGCGVVHGYTELSIVADLPPPAEPGVGQFAHRLVVDDELAAITLADGFLGASRPAAACARVERIHLGTGEVVASTETCATPELAAQLGPVALDPMLPCDDAQLCATNDYTWENECTPYDPELPPPPPPSWPGDPGFDPICPDASVFVDSGAPADAPTTGAENGTDTDPDDDPTDDPDDDPTDTVGAEDELPPGERGCACSSGTGRGPAGLLLLLLIAGTRRRVSRAPARPAVPTSAHNHRVR